jgi:ATP-dependent helicase/nuclease subunit A
VNTAGYAACFTKFTKEGTMEIEKSHLALNDEQRAAAYCTKNAVIAAGAGSGKTMVLASRFVWLVTEKKIRVREILTLTFTKKATAQMYRRIYLLLSDIARNESGEKGKLARQALDEFAHARIQTLDSYSSAIVKQAANRYGISPDFTIDNERCEQLALDESLPFYIAHRGHPAIERLYSQKSPMSIADTIFASALIQCTHIESPPTPVRDITGQFAVICDEWKRQTEFIDRKLYELSGVYSGNEKYHPDIAPLLNQYMSGKITFPGEQELKDYFEQLVQKPDHSVIGWAESHPVQRAITDFFGFIASIKALNMAKGSPRNNPAKDIVYEFRDLFSEFSSLAVFCIQAGSIYSVLTLLSNLQQRYLQRKRAEGILTFSDVARLSRIILLEQHDIRQSEKESFKAIMIDEFQDNNELQKDLLFLLAEKPEITGNSVPSASDLSPDKLFFVGDEKQSIYRFRGADVSVFRKLKSELGSDELPLKTNYRSAPLLIGAFNAIFGGSKFDPEGKEAACYPAVFAPAEKITGINLPLFEASFTSLRAGKEGEGKLTLCILDKDDVSEFTEAEAGHLTPRLTARLSAVENEARFVAERINQILQEKNEVGGQKYQPNDIAILFRSRGPQHFFEKHLMLLNIPYASEDLTGFFLGGPVDDMMSVLRLATYPTDRAAYAQMLRSPFAGLSIQGLALCLASLEDSSSANPFGDEPLPLLGKEDKIKYGHGQQIYQKMLKIACTESISSMVSELWYGEGYRYETEWNPQTSAYRDMYDYLFHLAALADEKNQGLAAFTDYIHDLYKTGGHLDDIEIPLDRPGARASAVHLMSVHKSKGLEFPVVFLCCCDKYSRREHSDDIFDTGELGLTFNPLLPQGFGNIKDVKRNYFWERSLVIEKAKRTAELRRLLYVGMTRAEKELYLSGCLGMSKNSDIDNSEQKDGSFPLNLKRYVEERLAEAADTHNIPGDTILDNDTFFGLCLPAFSAHIPQEASALKEPPIFSIEKIPVYTDYYRERNNVCFSNDQKGLNAFFEAAEPVYNSVAVIKTPVVPKRHYSPTYLSFLTCDNLPGGFVVNNGYSGMDSADVFAKVDALLDHYARQRGEGGEKFNSGGFGTIAHICVEAFLSGEEPIIPSKLAGFLRPSDADTFLNAGKELARRFVNSPLGVIAKNSKERKSEFPFRSLIYADKDEIFINGTIDIVFEDKQTVYVVDFKTDGQELPGEHIPQMACYNRAASDLFAVQSVKECRTWLYYLRSGHAVEVTKQAREFKLERLVSK